MTGTFYFSWEQTVQKMTALERMAPGLLLIEEWGKTEDGRGILGIHVGDAKGDFHLLIQGGMHGREYMNCAVLLMQLEEYLKKGVSKDLCIHLLPMVNPDGCTISQQGPAGIRSFRLRKGLWEIYEREGGIRPAREYFSRWKANAKGVDPNRNFMAGWEKAKKSRPSSEGYPGTAPETEKETQAILKLQKAFPLSLCVSYHSSGNLVYWDYGAKGELFEREKRLASDISRVTGYPICSTQQVRAAEGGCSDHFVLHGRIPAVTIETGESPCPLPQWELRQIYEKNRQVWDALAKFLGKK